MNLNNSVRASIDSYLIQLRRELRGLPQDEVEDVLREFDAHIVERLGENPSAGEVRDVIQHVGSPQHIASLYQSDAMVSRAGHSLSPKRLLQGSFRWAMVSAAGWGVFVFALIGYALGLSLIGSSIAKLFAPENVGMWVGDGSFYIGWKNLPTEARELMGWWLVPAGLALGSAYLVVISRTLRWMIRNFARIQGLPRGLRDHHRRFGQGHHPVFFTNV